MNQNKITIFIFKRKEKIDNFSTQYVNNDVDDDVYLIEQVNIDTVVIDS